MALWLEDYGLIGDTHTAALVGRDGSIDWLCLPRFDSGACFAALLGTPEHGRWLLAPAGEYQAVGRRYRENTLVLETDFSTADGTVRVVDCMPVRGERPEVLRRVEGVSGRVRVLRLDYGQVVPWFREVGRRTSAFAGPDTLTLDCDVAHQRQGDDVVAEFCLDAGQHVEFCLTWSQPRDQPSGRVEVGRRIAETEAWWRDWSSTCRYRGPYREAVARSLITLKTMSYCPSGGIVAAPTTSLPERLGGVRNWDYRFCWIRDATFTLLALLGAGYEAEAVAWREWLLRAVAGRPDQMQLMYGVEGERRLTEYELDWLPGYADSRPVRVGNAAYRQRQHVVWGAFLDSVYLHVKSRDGLPERVWPLVVRQVERAIENWQEPDRGIWEVRGEPKHFTSSKLMCWVACDRGARLARLHEEPALAAKWQGVADEIHADICAHGVDKRGVFVAHYDTSALDASLLLLPLVRFLPADDERVRATVLAICEELTVDGLVLRYRVEETDDGLAGEEGTFAICSFWLVSALSEIGEHSRARELCERLLSFASPLELYAEEIDPRSGRHLGNFPQAFTHLALINAVMHVIRADQGMEVGTMPFGRELVRQQSQA